MVYIFKAGRKIEIFKAFQLRHLKFFIFKEKLNRSLVFFSIKLFKGKFYGFVSFKTRQTRHIMIKSPKPLL